MSGKKKRGKKVLIGVGVALALLVGAGAVLGRNQSVPTEEFAMEEAQSVEVIRGDIRSVVSGTGSLTAGELVEVTAPAGLKVGSVPVRIGDKVTAGQALATIDDVSILNTLVEIEDSLSAVNESLKDKKLTNLKKEQLQLRQKELKDWQSKLQSLRKDPVIRAAAAGVIEGLSLTEGADISALSQSPASGENQQEGNGDVFSMEGMNLSAPADQGPRADYLSAPVQEDLPVEDLSALESLHPQVGAAPTRGIREQADYEGSVKWVPGDGTFQAGVSYAASIVLVAREGRSFAGFDGSGLPTDSGKWDWEIDQGGKRLLLVVTWPALDEAGEDPQPSEEPEEPLPEDETSSDLPEDFFPDDEDFDNMGIDYGAVDYGGSAAYYSPGDLPSADASAQADASGGAALSGGAGGYAGRSVTVCTINPMKNAKVSIQVDEQDILSVKEGQKATIFLDALDGKEIEAAITTVSTKSNSGGGSAKYTVEITVPMTEEMRLGMVASAEIVVGEAVNELVIPMLALQQSGNETFVYTGQDQDGALSDPVTVTTGVSDGVDVVITEGLSEGDMVYYTRTGVGGELWEDEFYF